MVPSYPDLSPLVTGLRGCCPRCGKGKLFYRYLKLADHCSICSLSYDFADSGDGAAWISMTITAIIGVGTIMAVEIAYQPAFWIHVLIGIPCLVLLPLALLRPVKAVLLNQQWKMKAQEGRLDPGGTNK